MLDRYMDRPDENFKTGNFIAVANMCYAEFLAYYVLDTIPKIDVTNHTQPDILQNDDITAVLCPYPKSLPLMSSKEKLRRRNVKRIVRYHTPNQLVNLEAYAHHLLMLFYPFRKETYLLSCSDSSYVTMLNSKDILAKVNYNKQIFDPWGDAVDFVLMNKLFKHKNRHLFTTRKR